MIVLCNDDCVDGVEKEEERERKEEEREKGKKRGREASDQLTRSNDERRIAFNTSMFKV